MQKTSNAKIKIVPSSNSSSTQHITKYQQQKNLDPLRSGTEAIYEIGSQQAVNRLVKKKNFKYYFYDKYNSTKHLKKLRNTPSTKTLLQKQRLKSARLDNQLKLKQQQILEGHTQKFDSIPFYKRYKAQPIFNDPLLADYGQFYTRKNLKRQPSPAHNFQKLKNNKQNLYKYRQTKGMISLQKKNQQNAPTLRSIDMSPKYNTSLSPFEFKNTIQGRLATRSDKNLRMDLNKTNKINNVKKIYYIETPDAQKQKQQFIQIRKSIEFQQNIKKCHSFDSYKGHCLFESRFKKVRNPADDKFYDPDGQAKSMSIYQRWRTQNHIDMSKSPDRLKQPQKLGTHLEYQINGLDIKKSHSKKCQMGISSSQRNLVFTRQVINPNRAYYR